jgi:hypothetical protein
VGIVVAHRIGIVIIYPVTLIQLPSIIAVYFGMALAGCAIIFSAIIVLRRVIGSRFKKFHLVIQPIETVSCPIASYRGRATFGESWRVVVPIIWRALLVQAPVYLVFWPLLDPLTCLFLSDSPKMPFWLPLLCGVSQHTFLGNLRLINLKLHDGLSLFALQALWITAVRMVIGRSLGRFRVVIEDIERGAL